MKESVTDTDELRVLGSGVSVAGSQDRSQSPDRRGLLGQRGGTRRVRRLYALGGLAVLAVFLAATVVVVDMVR